ncbi:MAG: hypothetical protein P4M01_14795 [Acidobacteriota bacterium]|nr:hypothetical protein [Acidobacteriota bacterium]
MRKSFIYGALFLLLLSWTASCHRQQGAKFKPSPLAPGLSSGESLEAVERKLHMMAGTFDIVYDHTPLPSDTRPPYRLLIISAKQQKVAGQAGRLEMTFFNDRLMTMQFYADDFASATRAVESAQKISLGSGDAHLEPNTRVWTGKDAEGKTYIGWIDKFLQAEQDAWIRQYEQ